MSNINDEHLLEEMKSLIFHDGDVRPVWVGPGIGTTDVSRFRPYCKWANEHWGLYRGFFTNVMNPSGTILDLGCGSGFCTINLSNTFTSCAIIGYDLDPVSVNFAKEHNSTTSVSYLCEDITIADFPSANYIFCVETLEHIKYEHQTRLIDRSLAALNKGGQLFICTPNEQLCTPTSRGHIGIMNTGVFNAFLSKYNRNIKSIEYYNNANLLNADPQSYTSEKGGSHYKIVLQNE